MDRSISPTDIVLANDIWLACKKAAKSAPLQKQELTDTTLVSHETAELSDRIPGGFCGRSDDMPDELSAGAIKLCWRIMKELVYGNYLWHFEIPNSGQIRSAIAELRRHQILIKTSSPVVHVVNPLYIWKGNPLRVAAHSRDCITENYKVCLEAIVPYRKFPDKPKDSLFIFD